MRIRFSKEISELEEKDIKYIWQKPDLFESLGADDVWLIYGRKAPSVRLPVVSLDPVS